LHTQFTGAMGKNGKDKNNGRNGGEKPNAAKKKVGKTWSAAKAATSAATSGGGKGGGGKGNDSRDALIAEATAAAWRPRSKKDCKKAGKVMASGPVEVPGLPGCIKKEWQQLPKEILMEYCKSKKMPRPFFPAAKAGVGKTGHSMRVVLPDAKKNKDKDVSLCPQETFESPALALQYAALLALYTLQPTLPLERKMPEPFATAWKTMKTAAPALKSKSKFNTKAERADADKQRRQRDNVREARQGERMKMYARVFMSDRHREFIGDVLRQARDLVDAATAGGGGEDDDDDDEPGQGEDEPGQGGDEQEGDEDVDDDDDLQALRERLTAGLSAAGFSTDTAARGAAHAVSTSDAGGDVNADAEKLLLDEAMDYLCLTLREDELPKQFDPRGKQLEVVVNDASQAARDALLVALGAGRMALPAHVCADAVKRCKRDGSGVYNVLNTLFRQLYAPVLKAAGDDGTAAAAGGETREVIDEEIEGLEAIYGSDFCIVNVVTDAEMGEGRHWRVNLDDSSEAASTDAAAANLSFDRCLEVVVPAGNRYPHEMPVLIVKHDGLSAQARLTVVQRLVAFAAAEDLCAQEQPFTFALVDWLREHLRDLDASGGALPVAQVLPSPPEWRLSAAPSTTTKTSSSKAKSSATSSTSSSSSVLLRGRRGGSRGGMRGGMRGREQRGQGQGRQRQGGDQRRKPPSRALRNDDAVNAALLSELTSNEKGDNKGYAMMKRVRVTLPAFKQRQDVIKTIRDNQVVVISGETGCGKSTQVPQFILESCIEARKGSTCHVVCTQPRRISAIGLAGRVSDERGEKVGGTVGYRIRMEAKTSQRTRITYMTTGILLRQLTGSATLDEISHVVIDEVHERTVEIDFLLLVLRHLLRRRPSLKLILMSATAQTETFARYFDNCPILTIPGRTFPVKDFFLSDVVHATGYDLTVTTPTTLSTAVEEKLKALKDAVTAGRAAAKAKAKGKNGGSGGGGGGGSDDDELRETALLATIGMDTTRIHYALVHKLVWHLFDTHDQGGILVFMPGAFEINKLVRLVRESMKRRNIDDRDMWVVPLHGSLTSADQQMVFRNTPRGVRKIVVATNIAETSITVNDIEFVIDCGRHKEVQYDAERRVSMLVETWVSRANATQRQGRAGRVKAGRCYRMFTRLQWADMSGFQLPEIQRSAVDHLCLQIKLLRLDKQQRAVEAATLSAVAAAAAKAKAANESGIHAVFRELLQPPETATVESAIKDLVAINALARDVAAANGSGNAPVVLNFGTTPSSSSSSASSSGGAKGKVSHTDEVLTPLGTHLAKLPVSNTRIGKLLIFGAILGCVTPAITIAALLSSQSPFVSPLDKRAEADQARMQFAIDADNDSNGGGGGGGGSSKQDDAEDDDDDDDDDVSAKKTIVSVKSDHMTLLTVYKRWCEAKARGHRAGRDFCSESFLSHTTLSAVDQSVTQFVDALVASGFLADGSGGGGGGGNQRRGRGLAHPMLAETSKYNANARSKKITSAVLCAGLYPNVLAVRWRDKYEAMAHGATVKEKSAREIKHYDERNARVFIHPRSFLFTQTKYESPWLVYHSKVQTSKLFVHDATIVTPYALLLFGGKIGVDHQNTLVTVDDWIRFRAPNKIAVLIKELRRQLNTLLASKIATPSVELTPADSPVIAAVLRLLVTDGF
jgi:ATP-dependent RNA helicase DHX57